MAIHVVRSFIMENKIASYMSLAGIILAVWAFVHYGRKADIFTLRDYSGPVQVQAKIIPPVRAPILKTSDSRTIIRPYGIKVDPITLERASRLDQ